MGNAMEHLPVAAPLSPAPRDKEAERRRFWDEELLAAVEQGNLHQAEAALREGASVDARDVEGGGGGWTALHLAASRGDTALVRLLLESGAHPGRRDAYGWTALHFAASTDFALGVRLLACAGADPEARDAFGCTPLHLAARWDRQAALLELLRLGANAHAHDARGLTPFERAPSARVRRLLRSQGAAHAGSRAAAAAAARGDLAHGVRYRVSMDGSEDVELPKSPCDKVPDSSAWRIFQRNKSNEGAELATSHGDVAETKKNEHSPKGEKEKVSNVTTDPNIQEYNPDVSDTNELAMEEIYDSGEILMEKTSGSADTFAQVSITENKENIDSENKDESEPKSN